MAWARVDDQFTDHIKVISLSLGARGMWLSGLVYAARRSTDGFIPASLPRRESGEEDPKPYVDALVDAGLWVRVDGGYEIHDYLEYNPSKVEADAKREQVKAARSDAGKRGADSRWNNKQDDQECTDDSKPIANGITNEQQTNNPIPVPLSRTPLPVNPNPQPEPKEGLVALNATTGEKRKRKLPDDWQPEPALIDYGIAQGFTEDQVRDHLESFRLWFQSRGTPMVNWTQAAQGWLRTERKRKPVYPLNGNGRGPKGPDFAEIARQMRAQEASGA